MPSFYYHATQVQAQQINWDNHGTCWLVMMGLTWAAQRNEQGGSTFSLTLASEAQLALISTAWRPNLAKLHLEVLGSAMIHWSCLQQLDGVFGTFVVNVILITVMEPSFGGIVSFRWWEEKEHNGWNSLCNLHLLFLGSSVQLVMFVGSTFNHSTWLKQQ